MDPISAYFNRLIKSIYLYGMESFGKYYSSYRGFVADNKDPLNLGRLKLIIPTVTGPQQHNYWSWPTGVFSGKGYGSQCLPQIGDVVWVEFEMGCVEVPMWRHGHFGANELPTGDDDLKDPSCFWFVTPKGIKVKLNDTKNTIHIENQSGLVIQMDGNGISIVSTSKISLGKLATDSEASTYKALLGDKVNDLWGDLMDALSASESSGAGSPSLDPTCIAKLALFKTQFQQTLSTINTLE